MAVELAPSVEPPPLVEPVVVEPSPLVEPPPVVEPPPLVEPVETYREEGRTAMPVLRSGLATGRGWPAAGCSRAIAAANFS